MKGIKISRSEFEKKEDRGFFGKEFSRYFNYIECYFFRFGIGMSYSLCLKPLSMILGAATCLTATLLSPLLLTAPSLIQFSNIFFFDFDNEYHEFQQNKYKDILN